MNASSKERGAVLRNRPFRFAGRCWRLTTRRPKVLEHTVSIDQRVGVDTEAPLPALVYCHGGGFVVGDCNMVETICSTVCRDANIIVASVDYRLAPEHPFPAGLEDTVAVTKWIVGHGGSIGIDTSSLAIGSDSAGGNLAATALQLLANDEDVRI